MTCAASRRDLFRFATTVWLCTFAATACEPAPSSGPDASADATCQPDTTAKSEATSDAAAADMGGDASATTSNTWATVVVTDKTKESDCKKTTAPGAEIDAIAVYRKDQLIGVVAVGSAVVIGTLQPTCGNNAFANASTVEGPIDGSESKGVFALNGGGVEVAFGGCSACTAHVADCDGKGDPVALQPGDELDVYELDTWHVGKLATAGKCTCTSDPYEVKTRRKAGSDDGAFVLGTFTGTVSHIKVF
jgi:hypothetical protein